MTGARGRAVVLNGAAASAKSALATALVETLSGEWQHVSLDDYAATQPAVLTDRGIAMIRGFHDGIARRLGEGINVVVTHCLQDKSWAKDLRVRSTWDGILVAVHCTVDGADRSDQLAGRRRGLSAAQEGIIHGWLPADLHLDVSEETLPDNVRQLCEFVRSALGSRAGDH